MPETEVRCPLAALRISIHSLSMRKKNRGTAENEQFRNSQVTQQSRAIGAEAVSNEGRDQRHRDVDAKDRPVHRGLELFKLKEALDQETQKTRRIAIRKLTACGGGVSY